MSAHPMPDGIMQLGTGFWGSKTLLSAAELGVFTELARQPLDARGLQERLGLHPRSARDFFDALVALGMLRRVDGRYSNTPETDLYLDREKSSYIGGWLEMMHHRLYRYWGSLTEGLRTGLPQNEAKEGAFHEALLGPGQLDQVRLTSEESQAGPVPVSAGAVIAFNPHHS